MTDYREEQEGEVEALRSIYPEDELKSSFIKNCITFLHLRSLDFCCGSVLSEDPYCLEVKIAVEDGDNSQGEYKVFSSRDSHVISTPSECGCEVYTSCKLP